MTRARASVACGIDLVEIARIRRAVERGGERFVRRVFTAAELRYANDRPRSRWLHLAARFAAKEAVVKAVSQLQEAPDMLLHHVEIVNDRWGRPRVKLHGRALPGLRVCVSLTHTGAAAAAMAVAVRS